jgi:Ankyrin repeats (3 copies)/Ankyrin repeat
MGLLHNLFGKKSAAEMKASFTSEREPVPSSKAVQDSTANADVSPSGAVADDVQKALAILDDAHLTRHDEELQKRVDEALDSISATGQSGIAVLLERLYRDMKVVGSELHVGFSGDSAWNEWLKKKSVANALGRSRAEEIIQPFSLLLTANSDIDQFYNILQPAVIDAIVDVGGKSAIEVLRHALDSGNIYGSMKRVIGEALVILEGGEPPSSANARDKSGLTPLHRAANEGRGDVVEELLAQGADINIQGNLFGIEADSGCTPLHLAVIAGHKDVAELLISRGADVDSRCDQGTTPLHRAAATGNAEIAEILRASGADINARTAFGRTPLWWAQKNFHAATKELLLKHGGTL